MGEHCVATLRQHQGLELKKNYGYNSSPPYLYEDVHDKVRQSASANGSGTERVAYNFAKALEGCNHLRFILKAWSSTEDAGVGRKLYAVSSRCEVNTFLPMLASCDTSQDADMGKRIHKDCNQGLLYSVGRVKQECSSKLRHSDFSPRAREQINFPREGSKTTPPHQSKDFKWTDYCPRVFRKIRSIFKISEVDYLISLSENEGLRELCSPGKSGSVFFLSNDDRYMIKTLRTSEVKVLLKMLLSYYDHLCKNAETLIVKFFGLHQVIPDGGKKVWYSGFLNN
ncbi:hypothetical protein L7F22_016789 [Adiantum nelumboides]|nr:hypothetical protein [Adiantum nelumboides]